jgi:SAM-dependent methyltransferase
LAGKSDLNLKIYLAIADVFLREGELRSDKDNGESLRDSNSALFDHHANSYSLELDKAVRFSGKDSEFFVSAKGDLLKRLLCRLGISTPIRILDVGCGTGSLHSKLKTAGMQVSGVDLSNTSLLVAKSSNPDIEYTLFDGTRLPFEDGSFDVALAVCVFHHVDTYKRENLLAEMARSVRVGGAMFIIEHNPVNPLTRLVVSRCAYDETAVLLPAKETRSLMRNVGAVDISTVYFLFFPFEFMWLQALEYQMEWLPIGAQYCTYGIKK